MTEPTHPVDLLPELALGVLSADESVDVLAHLRGCQECGRELAEMQRVTGLLPFAATDVNPSPAVKDGLLERIAHEPRPIAKRQGTGRPRWWIGTIAAGVAALLVVGGIAGYLLNGGTDTSSLKRDSARDSQLLGSVAQGNASTAKATSGGMQLTFLRAPGAAEGFAWVQSFPALPSGKAYQTWFTRDGKSFEPGAVFSNGNGGVWLMAGGDLNDYAAMAFTIEDSAGAKQPTQDPFVVVPLKDAAMNITVGGD